MTNPINISSDNAFSDLLNDGHVNDAINVVSVKLPPYWSNNPKIWFKQIESCFTTKNIRSSLSKFHHVIASLPPNVASEVMDVISFPPEHNPYETLKSELIERTSISESSLLKSVLLDEELGDRRPSQLLRLMQQGLGEKHVDEIVIKELWLSKLPLDTRRALVNSYELPLNQISKIADKLHDIPVNNSLNSLYKPSKSNYTKFEQPETNIVKPVNKVEELKKDISLIKEKVDTLLKNLNCSPKKAQNYQNKTSSGKGSSNEGDKLCFYHNRFGNRAHKCVKPCSWGNENIQE